MPPIEYIENMYPEVFAAAKKGEADACLAAYMLLENYPKDGLLYLKKAAEGGNTEAKDILKTRQERKRERKLYEKTSAAELKEILKLAKAGDADKQYQAGWHYTMDRRGKRL